MALHGRAELELAPDEFSGLTMVLLRMLAFRPGGTGEQSASNVLSPRAAPAPATLLARPAGVATRVPVTPPPRAARTPKPVEHVQSRAPAPAMPVVVAEDDLPPWLDAPAQDIDAPSAQTSDRMGADPRETLRGATGHGATASADSDEKSLPPAVIAPVSEPELAPDERVRGDRWHALVRDMSARGAISALVRELAQQAQCVAVDAAGLQWQLHVERETLRTPGNIERLTGAMRAVLGEALQLQVESGPTRDTPALRDAAEVARRQLAAENDIRNDPDVIAVMQQFKTARIVPGSIKPL